MVLYCSLFYRLQAEMPVLHSTFSDVRIPQNIGFSHFMLKQFEKHGHNIALVIIPPENLNGVFSKDET